MRRIATLVITVMLIFAFTTFGIAEGKSIAEKTATSQPQYGRYELEVQVPGGDGREMHDEVILMVDGSYSTDEEWDTVRNAIVKIGETVLEGSGNTQLTLMTFGMGDNIVFSHVQDVSELSGPEKLPELPGGLLYGRSSTNCEAGFTGIEEYIDSHDSSLNDVYVVFISDGRTNTDETPYNFYNWTQNSWLRWDKMTILKEVIAAECRQVSNGKAKLSNAYKKAFGEEILSNEQINAITEAEAMRWADNAWEDVYAYSNMNPNKEYPVSDAERAWVKYDKENGTYIQDMFYYALLGRKYSNHQGRALDAGIVLANHGKVKHLYLVDADNESAWMANMESKAQNVSFYVSGKMSNLLTALSGVITNLKYTPYNDVVITDFISKWVHLDKETLKIRNNTFGEIIWTQKDGWKISSDRPTDKSVPVVVEEVPEQDYVDGGSNVIGNSNGIIHKLTWYVKDGPMLRNHNFSLLYEVDVDVDENGFQYGKEYPANGITEIEYFEKDGNKETKITEDIEVPDVIVDKPKETPTPIPTATPSPTPTVTPSPTPIATPTLIPIETPPPTPPMDIINSLPKTGDGSNIYIWVVILLISVGGIIIVNKNRKK